ncbi:shTK domain protein [Teladorsagia circumcincta]|uniref:ShTK domain protein n=1 Tax=Teladorsagia circumcincta TaxID=45464 RepID=A0A2G9UGP8_TELCI|nr:shTK domain protein [Teladorsagia circumcincta]
MLVFLLLTTFLVNKASAQACMTGAGAGPCLNNMCTPGFTCIQDINECCPDASLITTVATLAPGETTVSSATVSTVSGATVTVPTASTASSELCKTLMMTFSYSLRAFAACVDKVNPTTGVSDCAARGSLCNDATYYAVMTDQCPQTCGRCSGSSTNTTCVDKINPSTGVSDCPALSHLCTNTAYTALMTDQCPRTCNRCSSSNSTATTTSEFRRIVMRSKDKLMTFITIIASRYYCQ